MTRPGTNPLVTISAKESNCKPNSLFTLSWRASNPSKKSKKIPKKTKYTAKTMLPFTACNVAIQPQNRFNKVIKFGMCFFKIDNLEYCKNNKLFQIKTDHSQ